MEDLPVKRKRGRPRKGEVVIKKPPKQKRQGKRVLSDEHKKALVEGRKKALEKKIKEGKPLKGAAHGILNKDTKPVFYITGKEKNAFGFVNPVNYALRARHDYITGPKIVHRITRPNVWQDLKRIKEIISEYGILTIKKEASANKKSLTKKKNKV